jgi:hypothetical protein
MPRTQFPPFAPRSAAPSRAVRPVRFGGARRSGTAVAAERGGSIIRLFDDTRAVAQGDLRAMPPKRGDWERELEAHARRRLQ